MQLRSTSQSDLILKIAHLCQRSSFQYTLRRSGGLEPSPAESGGVFPRFAAQQLPEPAPCRSSLEAVPDFVVRAMLFATAIGPAADFRSELFALVEKGCLAYVDTPWPSNFEMSWKTGEGPTVIISGRPFDLDYTGIFLKIIVDGRSVVDEHVGAEWHQDDPAEFGACAFALTDKGAFVANAIDDQVIDEKLIARITVFSKDGQVRIDGKAVRLTGYSLEAFTRLCKRVKDQTPEDIAKHRIGDLRDKLRAQRATWVADAIKKVRNIGYVLSVPPEDVRTH